MQLIDLVQRTSPPEPWAEGDNIPWNEPAFSQRMLNEHLSQSHDMASRRNEIIDQHTAWIHSHLLGEKPARLLDLGCGPGLYTSRLARMGHTCTGIDYAPAALAYARQTAQNEHLTCTYLESDLRSADFGTGYDLIMQIFGELNVFSPQDARVLLRKARAALRPGGLLLLEVHTDQKIRRDCAPGSSWNCTPSGLFSDQPHIILEERFWDEASLTGTIRYYVVDAHTGAVTRCVQSLQAYTAEGYNHLLTECGFSLRDTMPGLAGMSGDFPALVAE